MTHVEIEDRIEAPADQVWDCLLGSRADELAIGVYAESVVTEGSGVGMVRISKLMGGIGTLKERIDALDDKTFHCRYTVIERGPLPFADYHGQMDLTPDGPNACTIKLQGDFTPAGMTEEESINIYLHNNRTGIAKIKSFLGVG